jgi:prolyl oligopeptidase PreP (S9A serine peptidase family)
LLDVFDFVKDKRTISEFGNIQDPEIFKTIRSYNPYFLRFPEELPPTLLCADYDHDLAFQSIKFLAKSRESKSAATVLYKEYPTWTTEDVKRTEEFSFLIENTKVRSKK